MSDSQPVTCICPGSYDPVTNGHLDIIRRTAGIFERVVVGVVRDPQHKATMFSVDERVAFLREALADLPNVQVEVFSDLVVEFARRFGARTMVKGLRAISDFAVRTGAFPHGLLASPQRNEQKRVPLMRVNGVRV